jgi:hypothetical protein
MRVSFNLRKNIDAWARTDILQKSVNEVSGSIRFERVRYFSTLNREFGFLDHHQAAEYSVKKSIEYGLKEAVLEQVPIKSEVRGFRKDVVRSRPFWSFTKGEIRLVEPYPLLSPV